MPSTSSAWMAASQAATSASTCAARTGVDGVGAVIARRPRSTACIRHDSAVVRPAFEPQEDPCLERIGRDLQIRSVDAVRPTGVQPPSRIVVTSEVIRRERRAESCASRQDSIGCRLGDGGPAIERKLLIAQLGGQRGSSLVDAGAGAAVDLVPRRLRDAAHAVRADQATLRRVQDAQRQIRVEATGGDAMLERGEHHADISRRLTLRAPSRCARATGDGSRPGCGRRRHRGSGRVRDAWRRRRRSRALGVTARSTR